MNSEANIGPAEQLLRGEIREIDEYALKIFPARIKLNQNENPYELPEEVRREILDRLSSLNWSRYPPFVPDEQLELLSRFAGWQREGTLLGNGSNDLLQLVFACLLEKGRTAVISQPTFTLYKILARSAGANVVEVPMTSSFEFDVDRIVEEANKRKAALIVVCSPNNPTGSLLSREALVHVVESTASIVLLDEAYVQFAGESREDLLAMHDRLVILRTFSKAMGGAGLRLGYGLMAPALAKNLNKVKLPYSVNVFTLTAAEVLVKRWDVFKGWIDRIVAERERLFAEFQRLPGVQVHPSRANFLLVEALTMPASVLFSRLLERGILIRDVSSYPMLKRGVRISVGTPKENDELLSALKEVL